jgi:hypothetical protein
LTKKKIAPAGVSLTLSLSLSLFLSFDLPEKPLSFFQDETLDLNTKFDPGDSIARS